MQLLHMLVPLRTPFVEQLFGLITRFGEETVAIVLICTVFWCVDKRLGYGIGFSFFLSGLLVQGLKIGFRVDRPWIRDPNFQPALSAMEKATGYSFPSGHTQTATALFGSLGLGVKRRLWRVVLYMIPLLVGISRMVLGVHTPQDVLVSWGLAALVSLLVMRVWMGKWMQRESVRQDILLSGVVAAASVLLMLLAAWLFRKGLMDHHYMADSFKMAGSGMGFSVGYLLERRWIRFSVETPKWWMQLVKILVGIGVLLALQHGLKPILGSSAGAGALRYAVMILWALAVWPLLFKGVRPRTGKPG